MLVLRSLPLSVGLLLRGLPRVFRYRHQLVFSWLLLMQIIAPGRKTLKQLARYTPLHIADWHFRRLLSASYWSFRLLLGWFASEAIKQFPPPKDGVIFVIGDGSHKDKRAKKHPATQKGRQSKYVYFFGIKFIVMMVSWETYRIPVDFELVLPKTHPGYQNENTRFRQMVKRFEPPDWAKQVIVLGDCAFASRENMRLIQQRDKKDKHRRWGFVFGIARTWKQNNSKSLKNLVTHLPRHLYQKTWIPWLAHAPRRKTFWTFTKQTTLRHIGDVTIVLSKKGRNHGPKRTKLIVTNLPNLSGRQIVGIYARRWQIEILFRELSSDLGLGQHQVTGDIGPTEKSFALGIIAYLFGLRSRHHDICLGHPWSFMRLQHHFIGDVITSEVQKRERLLQLRLTKALGKAA